MGSANARDLQATGTNSSPFTIKAIGVGCFGAFAVSAGSAYAILYLHGSFMALGTSMPGAVFLLFVLTLLINPLLKSIHPRAGLNRRELLVVYVMMIMASPVPTLFVARLFKTILYPVYFATPENNWGELILPHLPDWLAPRDPEIARLYFEGTAQGQAIPWADYQPIFLAWSPFVWALFLMMISSMVLLRKQWVDHERLIFPLMQVPLAMSAEGAPGSRLSPFYKNPVMWAGFAVPALWGTLHGLYNYFPEIVPIATDVDPIRMEFPVFPATADLYLALRFNILGFFYFLKTEIAFSLWFFNRLSYLVRGLFGVFGISSSQPGAAHGVYNIILAHNAMGAGLVLFLGGLWMAREHLAKVFRKALLGDPAVDDSDEILSYRAAVIILLVSNAIIVGWLYVAGLPVWWGIALLFLAITVLYVYSRVVAEGGLSDGTPTVIPAGILVSTVGASALGSQSIVILATTYFWTSYRNFVMVTAANSLRLAEELGPRRRPLFWVMLLALAVALVGAVWMIMLLAHKYGTINLYNQGGIGPVYYGFVEAWIRDPPAPYAWGWINTGIGAAIMSLLMMLRTLFVWWPLHPLGYAIGTIGVLDHLWFNLFLAWGIKVIVLKYGGIRLYMKTRPFFLGMILGYFAPGGFYLIVDHFTGMTHNVIFWG